MSASIAAAAIAAPRTRKVSVVVFERNSLALLLVMDERDSANMNREECMKNQRISRAIVMIPASFSVALCDETALGKSSDIDIFISMFAGYVKMDRVSLSKEFEGWLEANDESKVDGVENHDCDGSASKRFPTQSALGERVVANTHTATATPNANLQSTSRRKEYDMAQRYNQTRRFTMKTRERKNEGAEKTPPIIENNVITSAMS